MARSLPKWVAPTALAAAGGGACVLAAVLAFNTWRKMQPRASLCPGRDPDEDARVAALMADRKLEIADALSAAIQLETVSWDPPTDAGHPPHRSGCANPLHDHGSAAVDTPAFSPPPAAVVASRAALLSFHGLLARRYPRMHAALERHVVGDLSLLFVWRGSDASLPATALYAHLDVVPASEPALWSFAPFGGEVRDGFVHGRGAIDDKQAVVGICEAVEFLLGQAGSPGGGGGPWSPRRTVAVLFGHDEEIGGFEGARLLFGAQGIGAHLPAVYDAQGAPLPPLALLLDEGPMVVSNGVPGVRAARTGLIGTAEKGAVTVELTAAVTGGHASQPPRRTAIGALARAVSRLEAHPFPASLPAGGPVQRMLESLVPVVDSPLLRVVLANLWLTRGLVLRVLGASPAGAAMTRTTTALTVFHAGDKTNTLPSVARAAVNHRIAPGETVAGTLARDAAVIADPGVTLRPVHGLDVAPVTSDKCAAYSIIAETTEGLFARTACAPALMIGNTDSRWAWGVAAAIFRFSPTELDISELPMFHGVDERIGVDNLARAAAFYARVIVRADSADL